MIKSALKGMSRDNQVRTKTPSSKGRKSFAYEINIDRLKGVL